ncbi:MAG: SpoIIE family protein phosphatase [Spirochaetia bacterium]|nr:SpoIIE family protein phosphatase [Spirochaetia bacterium]
MNDNLYLEILHNSPIGYCVISNDLELEFINDKLLKLLEISYEQVTGKKWVYLIIEKNYLQTKSKIFLRWLKIKFNAEMIQNKYILKIFEDSGVEFYMQIDRLLNTKKKLVTIYPVSGTILLHQSRISHKLNSEYEIAGRIQRNINNYIMDMIEGRFFKYHFKRLFMPSGVLSGDIVNIKPVSRRYSSVFLGDGRGHGLPAALYSSLIHSYLNIMGTEVNQGINSSAALMQQINKYAFRDFSETGEFYFFSGIYGLIDGNTRDFCITNAGHPYPLFIRNGEVTRLESNGALVGIDKNSIYTENKFELKNGDVMLFFTDGLYDIFVNKDDSEHDGITAIVREFLANTTKSSDIFNYLTDIIKSFKSKLDINDDITILQMSVEEK